MATKHVKHMKKLKIILVLVFILTIGTYYLAIQNGIVWLRVFSTISNALSVGILLGNEIGNLIILVIKSRQNHE